MSEDEDPAVGKAGRNEARKLRATWLNNVSVAFAAAAVLQPALALSQGQVALTLAQWVSWAMFAIISGLLYLRSQRVALKMED